MAKLNETDKRKMYRVVNQQGDYVQVLPETSGEQVKLTHIDGLASNNVQGAFEELLSQDIGIVKGVKGANEEQYRSGYISLSTEDIGAEPAFQKNTAFNKNFGQIAGTVVQGNDYRFGQLQQLAEQAYNVAETADDKADSALVTSNEANANSQEAKSIAQGRARALVFNNVTSMADFLRNASRDELNIGDNLFILDTGVPDYWISQVNQYPDAMYGYYSVSQLETQTVDVSGYVQKTRKIAGIDLQDDITKYELQNALELDEKVDKVAGKQLSANDFTDTLKTKLDGIASGAEVNVQSDWSQSDNTKDDYIKNKPDLTSLLNAKVDKVSGKWLSTEDYTTADKTKLTNLPTDTVRYGESQSLTDAQKAQARSNIGAGQSNFSGAYADLSGLPTIPDELKDLADDSTHRTVTDTEKSTWNNKQDALASQTAYSQKGTTTKVPQITTNALGQVTDITEKNIAFPVTSVNGQTGAITGLATTGQAFNNVYRAVTDLGLTAPTTIQAYIQAIITGSKTYSYSIIMNENNGTFTDAPASYGTLIVEVGGQVLRQRVEYITQVGNATGYKRFEGNIIRSSGNTVSSIEWRSVMSNKIASNPNLLINGDFRVNQRGKASYTNLTTATMYGVDRWSVRSGATFDVANRTLSCSNITTTMTQMYQLVEDYEKYKGLELTVSIKVKNVSVTAGSPRIVVQFSPDLRVFAPIITSDGIYKTTFTVPDGASRMQISLINWDSQANSHTWSMDIDYIKLEMGDTATAFSPKPYAEELLSCQRYYHIYETQSARPNKALDCVPTMRVNPTQGTVLYGQTVTNATITGTSVNKTGTTGTEVTTTDTVTLTQQNIQKVEVQINGSWIDITNSQTSTVLNDEAHTLRHSGTSLILSRTYYLASGTSHRFLAKSYNYRVTAGKIVYYNDADI